MAGRYLPETANRKDWPRLVADAHRGHENRIAVNESSLADHETRVTANEADIADHESRITTLEAVDPVLKGIATWTAATGTASRAALASYAGQTVSNPPTQAEVQALDNAVVAISQAVVALITDLRASGLLS